MIFVSVGTHEAPFDRMLEAVYSLDLDEELVVQHGPSRLESDRARSFDYLSFDETVAYVREARAVVTHAGVGSVMVALANGKRPIVMARLHEFGEHVDDHQLELARRLTDIGLVTVVADGAELEQALAREPQPVRALVGVPWLGNDLQAYLADELGEPQQAASAAQAI
jgi:UDP-N-acetylglucosamine transferase subunit ALG13